MAKRFDVDSMLSESAARPSQPVTPLSAGIVAENMRAEARERIDAADLAGRPAREEDYRQLSQAYAVEEKFFRHMDQGGSEFDYSKEDRGIGVQSAASLSRRR